MRKLTGFYFLLGTVLFTSATLVAQQPPAGAPAGAQPDPVAGPVAHRPHPRT